MESRLGKFALLIVMMTFFAMLALDITVPATVLGIMALANSLLLSGSGAYAEETA